jgi:hypothetical protein
LKESFYKEYSINTKQNFLDRQNIEILVKNIDKKLDLSNYDKRKFIENRKKTIPLFRLNEYNYV